MDAGAAERIAAVTFANAREAARSVAGVSAAARAARGLAGAGAARVRLVLPEGEALPETAWADLRRLGLAARVEVVPQGGEATAALTFDGGVLVPTAAVILLATGKASDGPVSRYLNRPLSRRISSLLLRLPGIRPVHATLGTALLAVAMCAALFAGGSGGMVAGALLFQAASIFDGVDGEIARATFRASPAGAVLDSGVDVATNIGFVAGLSANLAADGSEAAIELAAWGFVLLALGLAIIAWRAARMQGPFSLDLVKNQYHSRFEGGRGGMLIRFLTIVSGRDFFALLFALLVLMGASMAVLYLFAAAATVWILFVLGSIGLPVRQPASP